MATFETEVEALTGISIDGSSNPTQTELSSFLVDGIVDVVNRMIALKPEELSKFTKTTHDINAVVKKGQILSVVREHDSTAILRKCTKIDAGDRYDATDSNSLLFRSKTSPGFYELNGSIYTVPAAGSGNNDIVVTQVHYDTGLVYSDTYNASAIENFPLDYERLVALYAAIQALQNKMSGTIISISSVPPDVPTITAQSASVSGNAPTYTVPTTTISGTAWATAYPDQYADINTAWTAINTELDETQAICDSINTNVDSAVTELTEGATQVDASIDTALAAITTAAGRINTAVALANDEFDEVATQVSGSKDSPITDAFTEFEEAKNLSEAYNSGKIKTALYAISTELDKVDEIIDVAKGKVTAFYTDIAHIDDETELWDDTNKRFTVVRDALLLAQNLIDNSEPHANYDAEANLSDIDNAFSTMDAHLVDGETVLGANPGSGDIYTALTAINTNIDLAKAVVDSPPAPPDVPTLSVQSVTITGAAPTYTPPVITNASDGSFAEETDQDITEMSRAAWTDLDFDFDNENIDFLKWFQVAGDYIQNQEDTELASAQLQKIASYISAYGQAMQNQLHKFNDANVEFQAKLQVDIQDAQLADGNEARKLQKYSAEMAEYQAELGEMNQRAQGYISTAQAYSSEVQARLSYATAYQQASTARGAEGTARISQLGATVSVAAQELQRANVAIAEINTIMASYRLDLEGVAPYLQTAQHHINQAGGYAQEVQTYATAMQAFIGTGSAYLQEATATIAAGNAYLAEAGASAQEAQTYANEVTSRIAQVGGYSQIATGYIAAAQGFATEIQTKIGIAQGYGAEIASRLSNVAPKVSEFQAKVADALNTFNKENVEYQALLQVDIQNAQLADGNEAKKLQKYSAEVAEYQAEVNTEVQEKTTKMQQYQLLHTQLKAEYDAAFAKPPPAPGE